MPCRIIAGPKTTVPVAAVDAAQSRSGDPQAGVVEFEDLGIPCGLWEHTIGTSTDIEVDEVFVVLAGAAHIDVEGQESLDVGPGDVVHLTAGARTTWHVTEPLRKFWVTP